MADFDKIKINGVPYNVKDTATAQTVAQVASDLAETNATVQQQGQTITQQEQTIEQQGEEINKILSGLASGALKIIDASNPPAETGLEKCVGDGVADDGAKLQAIISYAIAKRYAVLLTGVYKSSLTITINGSVSIIGIGTTSANYDLVRADDYSHVKSGIVYTGSGNCVEMHEAQGCLLANFSILGTTSDGSQDADKIASKNLYLDKVKKSTFYNLHLAWANAYNIQCDTPNRRYVNDNCMFNTFIQITAERAPICIQLDGNEDGDLHSNTCHTWFYGIYLDSTNIGIQFNSCDNIAVFGCDVFNRAGSWAGAFGPRSRSVYLYHFEGELLQNGSDGNNYVFGYDTENGQRIPYASAGNGCMRGTTIKGFNFEIYSGRPIIDGDVTNWPDSNFMRGQNPGQGSIQINRNVGRRGVWGLYHFGDGTTGNMGIAD